MSADPTHTLATTNGATETEAEVRLADGRIMSGKDAPIGVRISSIATRVKQMSAQMDRMELQMDAYEENLSKQFTAMEAAMAKLQSQGNQMSSIMRSF